MKNIILLICAALMVVGCGKRGGEAAASAAASARAGYTFDTSYQYDEYGQCNALILDCKSGEKSQQFVFDFVWSKDHSFLEEEGAGEIEEVDINGDGFADVIVALGNFGIISPMNFHGACVWNPASQCFDLVENYSGIPNAEPGFGDDGSTVASNYQGVDGTYFTEYYEWKDGKLVLDYSDSHQVEEDPEDAAADSAEDLHNRASYSFVTDFLIDEYDQCQSLQLECRSGEKSQDFDFVFNWPKAKTILLEEGSGDISESDINGDGWPDVVVSLGNFGVDAPLYFYGACIWNPDDDSFFCVKKYSSIPNAQPCQLDGKPAIKSVSKDPDGASVTEYYVWEGRKLVLKQ